MVRGEGLNSWEGRSAGVGIERVGKERTVEASGFNLGRGLLKLNVYGSFKDGKNGVVVIPRMIGELCLQQ